MEVYCRSCNRYVVVSSELPESYVEVKPDGKREYHPKSDCDKI